jgi:hypothetical protein
VAALLHISSSSPSLSPAPADGSVAEARLALLGAAGRRFGAIPAETIVEHILGMTEGADFAVREAALEALIRRWEFARRDELAVATRPGKGHVLGAYTTSAAAPAERTRRGQPRKSRRARPYTSVLERIRPIAGSCDCPDFLRSSLGLCKHLLVILGDIQGSSRRLALGVREGEGRAPSRARPDTDVPRLVWDPRLPLGGSLDRLSGLRLEPRNVLRAGSHMARLERAFRKGAPDREWLRDIDRRRDLLALLQAAISGKGAARIDSSPSARALVLEELERAERQWRNARAAPIVSAELRTLRRHLYPYQKEGVERFFARGRLLLADDMGLGKTTQAIAACHALFSAGRVARGLVIAPASLKAQWLREWRETTSVPAAVVDGTADERARQYRELARGFLILNYEQLLRDAEAVQALRPEMVVLDEAQRIKNYATKSAAYVKALSPEYRLVLTGTPMENRLEELASILDWVDDVALSPKWRLAPWYTQWAGDGGKGKVGARNLDTLRARLGPCVVRRVRAEVLAQLPPRTDTRVPVDLTPQQAAEHEELTAPIARIVQASKKRPLTQAEFLRLMSLLTQQRIIANGLGQLRFEEIWPAYSRAQPDATLLEGLFAPKLFELRRLVSDLAVAQRRKVVVFSQWRRFLRLAEWSLRDVLGAEGLRAVFFTGGERPSQRTKSVVDFHDDPRVAVMLLSDAGGVGLNLQKAASACINLELPWNPAVLEQRIGRIYRLGQKRPIDVFNLVSEGSIEARIAGLVGAKQALFSGLFDGTSDEVRFETASSFLTRVERLVDPAPLPPQPTVPAMDLAERDSEIPTTMREAGLAEAALADTDVAPRASEPNPERASGANESVPAGAMSSLFERLRVERTESGGVRIEAPPEAAATLVALFEGMAKLLSASAR